MYTGLLEEGEQEQKVIVVLVVTHVEIGKKVALVEDPEIKIMREIGG